MSFRLLDLPANISGCGVAGMTATLVVIVVLFWPSKLDAIPTVGSSSWLGSWWAGLKYLINALDVVQEGYEKHKGAPFKISEPHRWTVIISSREHIEELQRVPDGILSSVEATEDQVQFNYTISRKIWRNPYHIPILRSRLTRQLGGLDPEIRNEVTMAFDDILDLKGNEWKSVPALSVVQKVICRTSNRVFVGLPLCRNPVWIDLNIQYTFDVVKGATIIRFFPDFLKPMATLLLTNVHQNSRRARKLLRPVIEERQKYLDQYGNEWVDKPNDFLSWAMEEAEGSELTVESLTARIMTVNFAAIHTTSVSFIHVLFYLAANPQYIQPLREEVEAIVEKEGWSKTALGKMRKVDSFLKECQRLEGPSGVGLVRKAVKDFTFSDGTFIPKGTTISAAMRSIHYDEAFYRNAHAFEPFRFVDLHNEDGDDAKHQFASSTSEYFPFGRGRHTCAGRFFVANELMTMLSYVVVTYDVKLADGVARPQPLRFATAMIPDPRAEVMFRRRVD